MAELCETERMDGSKLQQRSMKIPSILDGQKNPELYFLSVPTNTRKVVCSMSDAPLRRPLKRTTSLKARELTASVPGKKRIDAHLSLRRSKRTSRRHEEEEKRRGVCAFADGDGSSGSQEISGVPQQQPEMVSLLPISDLLKNPRYRIMKEVKDSERTYLTFLQSVALLFYQPCKGALKTSTPILPAPLMDSLFGNILDVVELSTQVLQAIELLVHPRTWDVHTSTVGDFFLRLLQGDLPRVYSEYVEGYGRRLKALASTPEQFNMFRRSQEGSQLCGNHTLSSLLITPIQRIPRYVLLLRDLYRSTPEGHEDQTLLPRAIREFELLTAKLDAVKRKADTKDQFAIPLQSLAKKGDAELRTALLRGDIEAAGYLVEYHEGEFMPLFCVLFSEMIVGALLKKDGTVTRVRWKINLNSAFLTTSTRDQPLDRDIVRKYGVTDDYIVLTELRTIDHEPFSSSFSFELYPTKAPYDMGYWYNSILTVVSSLWFDNKVLLSNSYRFRQHLESNLFPMSQWKLIQLAATTQSYDAGDVILNEGEASDKLYMILEGSVKTIKPSVNVNITLARLRKNEFFGEFGYITFRRNASAATVIASKRTTVATISYVTLTSILLSDPGMMYRFFRFQCCILANRLVLQLFTQLNSSQLKQKRRDSAMLQRNLSRLSDPVCLEGKDEDSSPDEPFSEEEYDPSEEEVDLYIPPPPRAIADAPPDHPLTKKYSNLLAKHALQEHVLMELNVTLIRYSKSDARGKFLFLDQHICLLTKSGFSQKTHLIKFSDIRQVLENENQHMLVIIVSKDDVEELHCSFDSHSDYCRINSLLQTMSPSAGSLPAASSSDPFKGLDFEEDEWNLLLSRLTTMKVARGHYLTKLATTTQTVFQVISGSFIIRTNLSATASGLCPHAGPGAVFGDLTFIQGGISTADIIADTDDCEVICFEKPIIDELTHTDPMLAGKFYRFLAAKMVHRFLELQLQLLG